MIYKEGDILRYKEGDILRRSSNYEDMYLILGIEEDNYRLKRLQNKHKLSISFLSNRENTEKKLELVPAVIKLLTEL